MQQNTLITRPLFAKFANLGTARNEALFQVFTSHVSDEQLATLERCAKFGWQLTKLGAANGKCVIALATRECATWVLPDGTLQRAKLGEKSAVLANAKWME